jgi:putative peptidoglycan lipid II flippase
MGSSARPCAWPGRVVQELVGGPACAAARQAVAEAIRSARALSGYSLLTGLGLLLGLARELMVASTFGLSPQLDVFVAVMTLQLLFGAQVGNALETAFIGRVATRSEGGAALRSLRPALCGLLLVNAGVAAALLIGGAPMMAHLFPRFDADQQALAAHTLYALLLPMAFASTAGLLRASLAVLGSFALAFMAGSAVSICTIVSVAWFSSSLGIDALTLGVALGNLGVLGLFAVRLLCLHRAAASEAPDRLAGAKRDGWFVLWGAAATVLTGELLYAGIALTERSLASRLPPGSIAAFFYAGTIVAVPLSLFVIPLTTMVFPGMVQAFGQDAGAALAQLRTRALMLAAAGLAVILFVIPLAQPIVETVFMRGRFSAEHARLTASILSITILALPFMSVGRLIRNACYARSDYRTPLAGLTVQWTVLAGLGAALLPRYGVSGLAAAIVAGEAAVLGTMGFLLIRNVRAS